MEDLEKNVTNETETVSKAAENTAAEAPAETAAEPVPSMDEFKDEINKSFHKYAEGDVVTGPVIGVNETEVVIDLGSYAEGIIKADEMSNNPAFSLKTDVKVGDQLTAIVLKENKEGNLLLSVKKAADKLAWEELKKIKDEKKIETIKVAKAVKGGCITYLCGVRAFIPASQLSLSFVENLEEFEGKELQVVVITVDEAAKKLVLSAKEVLKEEKSKEREREINNLPIGTIVTGKVEKLMDFGAFVNIGNGISGLVHVSQIAQKRIKTPSEVLKVGDEVKVKLMSVKDGKLNLSIKAASDEDVKPETLDTEKAPTEYKSGKKATTSLGDIFKNLNINF